MTYKDELEAQRNLTIEQVQEAMLYLPNDIKTKLAEGPLFRRYDCGVCQAFGTRPNTPVLYEGFDQYMFIVWIYHEVPKVDFRFADQNHYGKGADDIYKRCIETYRAAGWTGEAEEPNAIYTRERYG